jgi:hypothetical protein
VSATNTKATQRSRFPRENALGELATISAELLFTLVRSICAPPRFFRRRSFFIVAVARNQGGVI